MICAASVGIIAAIIIYMTTDAEERLWVCNATPFKAYYVAAGSNEDGDQVLLHDLQDYAAALSPGHCNSFDIGRKKDDLKYIIYAATTHWVNNNKKTRNENTNLINYVYGLPSDEIKNIYWEALTQKSASYCLPKFSKAGWNLRKSSNTKGCDAKNHKSPFVPFQTVDRLAQINGDVYYILMAPGLNTVNMNNFSNGEELRAAIYSTASGLRQVIGRHLTFLAKWTGHPVPLHLGAELEDHNGPLASGVTVHNPVLISIFGDTLPFRHGDVLFKMNETDIFAPADVFQALIDHGYSYSRGITEPVNIVYGRAGKFYSTKTSYFFNEGYHQFSGDRKDEATFYGLLDAIALGLAAESLCAGENGLVGLADGLNSFANWLDKSIERKKFEYRSMRECIWSHESAIALAQQKHRDIYTNAAWLTIIFPNAPRLLLQKGATRVVKKVARNSAIASSFAGVGLELAETGFFFLNDRSALQTHANVAEEYVRSLPFIAGFTLAVGVIGRGR